MPTAAKKSLDVALSVNEIIYRAPTSIAVLNAYGIDTCCGGEVSLAESAREIGIAPETILRALVEAAAHGESR